MLAALHSSLRHIFMRIAVRNRNHDFSLLIA